MKECPGDRSRQRQKRKGQDGCAKVNLRAGCGKPQLHRGGAAGVELIPEPGVHAAPQQGVPKLAAAAAGPPGLGQVAHDGDDRGVSGSAGIPPAPDY